VQAGQHDRAIVDKLPGLVSATAHRRDATSVGGRLRDTLRGEAMEEHGAQRTAERERPDGARDEGTAEREAALARLQSELESSGRALLEQVERLREETLRRLGEAEDRIHRVVSEAVEHEVTAMRRRLERETAERVREEILDAASLETADPGGEDAERVQLAELTLGVRADSVLYRIDEHADERVARAAERIAEAEARLLEAVAESEREAHRRLLEAADAAFERIASADRAQEREALVRERAAEVQRESEMRVRDAERRLLELMERADAARPGA
jgi:hypothetical protein